MICAHMTNGINPNARRAHLAGCAVGYGGPWGGGAVAGPARRPAGWCRDVGLKEPLR